MGKKQLDQSVIKMTNNEFISSLNILFELEEKVGVLDKNHYKEKRDKKRIAVIYDFDGWAFCNIATQIKKHLSKYYDIDIFPISVFDENIVKILLIGNQYDLMHFFWRGVLITIESDYIKEYIHNMGFTYEQFKKEYMDSINITTVVNDHSFLNEECMEITETFVKYCNNYTVSSNKLKKIYDNLKIDKKPMMVLSDGVDLDIFKPKNLDRFNSENIQNRIINIGWVGNSEFKDTEGDNDLKGVRKIIIPVIEELIKEGYNISKKFADRKEGYIPYEKMPDYYNTIDIYICASKTEGTPDPVLEAMASGIPIISTDVGIVSEAFGDKQKKYIIEERTKEKLKEMIKKLISNKEMFKTLSEENLESVKKWSYKNQCYKYKEFFEKNMK